MTYDDWKTRSDRDEYPHEDDEDDAPEEPFEEPVSCGRCSRIHELQDSRFCARCGASGWCKQCWHHHNCATFRGDE